MVVFIITVLLWICLSKNVAMFIQNTLNKESNNTITKFAHMLSLHFEFK